MIVKVESGGHESFYEGNTVGFHPRVPETATQKDAVILVVEGRKNSITVEIERESGTFVFVMNDAGRTIDKKYF